MSKGHPISIIDSRTNNVYKECCLDLITNNQPSEVRTYKKRSHSGRIPTKAEIAARCKFIIRLNIIRVWIEKNKPDENRPNGTEEFQKMMAYYKKQHRIGNWRNFLFKYLSNSDPDF